MVLERESASLRHMEGMDFKYIFYRSTMLTTWISSKPGVKEIDRPGSAVDRSLVCRGGGGGRALQPNIRERAV